MAKHEITRDDLMPVEDYVRERRERRKRMTEIKRNRRLEVGPFATFYFESYATMWHQVHEMLAIERGGEAQIPDELCAYNPLIPKGKDLVATVMFEIDDPDRRKQVLGALGGVEETMFIAVDGDRIGARPETDQNRTSAAGKASSVQFVHFDFTPAQIDRFRDPATQVIVGIDHPAYGHMAVLPATMRTALAEDFD